MKKYLVAVLILLMTSGVGFANNGLTEKSSEKEVSLILEGSKCKVKSTDTKWTVILKVGWSGSRIITVNKGEMLGSGGALIVDSACF